jgi:hypothetical protein
MAQERSASAGRWRARRQLPALPLTAFVERRRERARSREIEWLEAQGRPRQTVAPARSMVPRQRWF